MKAEDIWAIVLIGFSILFTAAFGWGVFGSCFGCSVRPMPVLGVRNSNRDELHQCRHLPGGAGGRSLVQDAPGSILSAWRGRFDKQAMAKSNFGDVRHG